MSRKIGDVYLKDICKIGQGMECCRFLIVDPDIGITCAKGTEFESILQNKKEMNAQSDNCNGYDN